MRVHLPGSVLSVAGAARARSRTPGSTLGRVGHVAGALELDALVQQHRGVAAVVEDHVRAVVARRRAQARSSSGRCTTSTPRASRPSRRRPGRPAGRRRCRSGRRRRPRRRGPASRRCCSSPSAPRRRARERLDEHRGLDRHVQRAGDAGAGERLRLAVLLAQSHQAGHLVLGEHHLLAAKRCSRQVGDSPILAGGERRLYGRRDRGFRHGATSGGSRVFSESEPGRDHQIRAEQPSDC